MLGEEQIVIAMVFGVERERVSEAQEVADQL